MRAARYHGRGDVRIDDIPEPDAGPGEVKIRVPYNGICGSDLTEFYSGPFLIPPAGAPNPVTGVAAPVVIGHEFGGYVVDAGDDVEGLEVGQLVAVEPPVVCGTCASCRRGAPNLCENLAFHGFSTGTGGCQELAVVGRGAVHPVPESFTPQHAALVEPLAVAYHAVCRTEAAPGDTVVVHGAGPIGVGALLMLRHRGNRVIVVEPAAQRRDNLRALGADAVIDPTATDAIATIREMTDGYGASASIDAAGVPASFNTALATTAKQGRLVVAAVHKQPLEFNAGVLFTEMSITGSTTYCGDDYPSVIRAMGELAFSLDGWVEEIPLDAIVDRGIERLHRGEATKILVRVAEA